MAPLLLILRNWEQVRRCTEEPGANTNSKPGVACLLRSLVSHHSLEDRRRGFIRERSVVANTAKRKGLQAAVVSSYFADLGLEQKQRRRCLYRKKVLPRRKCYHSCSVKEAAIIPKLQNRKKLAVLRELQPVAGTAGILAVSFQRKFI